MSTPHPGLLAARDALLSGAPYAELRERFAWPQVERFNWALEWFDPLARGNDATALWLLRDGGAEERHTFGELAQRSDRAAAWLRAQGVRRGGRVVVMLGNQVELWEALLACAKLGAVVVPATTLLAPEDVRDRIERGRAEHLVARSDLTARLADVAGGCVRIAVGDPVAGWRDYAEAADAPAQLVVEGETRADDPLLLYFTSGTTSKPKLVVHTHASYPLGHLSTMYWIGLRPGDVHLNISSPGWAKHAWSSVFAPWNAEATVVAAAYERFDARRLLGDLRRCAISTFCAPPTVWRMVIQEQMGERPERLRELVSAGEPLNPEVIAQVEAAWGLTIRDGFGQTETTACIGNPPGEPLKPGSMGRALPGYAVALLDPATGEPADEGEISIDLSQGARGVMAGYDGDPERTAEVMRDGFYRTGDVASRDGDGCITYVGRADDVFKASDYRISPFELESVLLEHEAVAEAAVVPSPDPLRLAVPKAFVVLAAGWEPGRETALAILAHARRELAPYKRIRRLEFAELPKTVSGKVRRAELRAREAAQGAGPAAWNEDDFPELRAERAQT